MDRLYYETFNSPIGALYAVASHTHLYYLQPVEYSEDALYIQKLQRYQGEIRQQTTPLFLTLQRQLDDYFQQKRQRFSIPLKGVGTDFQRQVWHALTHVEYGQRSSYKQIAQQVGRPKAYQAVGSAIGKKPILILQPCHRILPLNGTLSGFSAGVQRKEYLLTLESII
ncbi:methylated-DNA--[protein]-cysteine S-methyltransferase [Dolosicoccus paucivorans]|uniref:methylated-DNA--[protein]-cysteine S-methyltransferase n=1 Tax=Dolosicoccus paucivorans TaxID=84521 RepID=A0A2N6SPV7_9LACT|nr:methylated-DNA--[protein]-cysteine S-methyltransferase [Dolosicoccus paucivorans]PMB84143.1 hypothetical protein CJ206_05465 [Dolosicoccus paucivorans]PMC59097.1 hypothetical protein CJ205_01120 [Dolosicoccus paucivorans]